MSLEPTLNKILDRYENLKKELAENASDPSVFIKLSKELSEVEEFALIIQKYYKDQKELEDLKSLLADESTDAEFKELAQTEVERLEIELTDLNKKIRIMLIPKDAADDKNAIIEDFSPQIYFACTVATQSIAVGNSKFCTRTKAESEASRKRPQTFQEKGFFLI